MVPNRSRSGYPDVANQSERLVATNIDLVRRIAHHLAARLPASVQVEDLVQSGMVGLIEAARQFQTGQGATFATYAGIRIRGAMIDELRRADWTPRSVHRNTRRISEAIQQVEGREGRAASDREIAQALGASLDEYHMMLQDSASSQILGLEGLFGEDAEPDRMLPGGDAAPLEHLEREQFRDAVVQALAGLPDKERLVLALYYDEELNLREIGGVMGITESRVSQIRSQALHRLRVRLQEWIHEAGS
ncbi:RNA polymerase, sigma 28 subunit, FliA/WhiG [Thiorhodococcus drewsii AZ1]|uniref:RNA polymerase sigma factor FliA n=1 Tax=Thiorhodococcus drewsii AZ1 TaxID=765913 RepID=G2E350_9GAMM|nr:RNA polymerase sigma factor FliA [Thiorhodococcus drewsii]EGV30512.1 RNA polymerase, sigma 28 subunit, FliA/WhiG [Thiorhodococcus drewsii AZ1]